MVAEPVRPLPLYAPLGMALNGAPTSALDETPARSIGCTLSLMTPGVGASVQTFSLWPCPCAGAGP